MKKWFKTLIFTAVLVCIATVLLASCSKFKNTETYRWIQQEDICFMVPDNSDYSCEYGEGHIIYRLNTEKVEIYTKQKEYFNSIENTMSGIMDIKKLSNENEKDMYAGKLKDNSGVYIIDCGYLAVFVLYDDKSALDAEVTADSMCRNESLTADWIIKIAEEINKIDTPNAETEAKIERNIYGEAELNVSYTSTKRLIKDRISGFIDYVSYTAEKSGLTASDIPSEFTLISGGEIKIKAEGAYSFEKAEYIFKYSFLDKEWREKCENIENIYEF